MFRGVFLWAVMMLLPLTATGARLPTFIDTLALLLSKYPSFALNLKLSTPVNPVLGVYTKLPDEELKLDKIPGKDL